MNKYLFLLPLIFMLTAQRAFCITETVSPDLQESLKIHTNEPNFMTLVFALLFVIFLIYITGIIYSKLNIVGAKTVKEHLKNSELYRAMVVSTTQLGQNKNLHVIELNDKYYLIGATLNSINLIKELSPYKSKSDKTSSKVDDEEIDKAIEVLYGEEHDEIIEAEKPAKDEFNVHKKYL
jgi:flagellar biogenesis protein FliO